MLRTLMTNLTDALHIPDTQSSRDDRHLAIQRVGVKGVAYPLVIEVAGQLQPVQAQWTLDVALAAEAKGTHMSRFVAWLDALHAEGVALTAVELKTRHAQMLERLNASRGRVEAAFGFHIRKRAPVSGVASLMDYRGRWIAESDDAGVTRVSAEVTVPVKTLCPCSKEISDYGAHNQRSAVTIRAELREPMAWHELVRLAEDQASSELWPLLKRPDEKWVTERAYENPKFVEDLVRDVALAVQREPRLGRAVIEVENFESIHNHSAWARIEL
jgi:GTP cyclohydrolase I